MATDTAEESPLVAHARRELELCGQMAEDPAYSESLIASVAAFASYGHSGGSAMVARHQLHALLGWQALGPITDSSDEWMDVAEQSGTTLWQNRRSPGLFSTDGGKTYYDVDDRERRSQASAPAGGGTHG